MAVAVRRVLSDSAILLASCFIKYRTSTVSGPVRGGMKGVEGWRGVRGGMVSVVRW
jgi:hypothetical protein